MPQKKGAEGLLVDWMRPASVETEHSPPPFSHHPLHQRDTSHHNLLSQLVPFLGYLLPALRQSNAHGCQLTPSELIWLGLVLFLNPSCWIWGSFGLVVIYIFFFSLKPGHFSPWDYREKEPLCLQKAAGR